MAVKAVYGGSLGACLKGTRVHPAVASAPLCPHPLVSWLMQARGFPLNLSSQPVECYTLPPTEFSIGAQDKLFYINAPTEACCLTSYCVDACHKGNSFLLTSCVLCGYWSLSSIVFQTSFPPCPSVLASCPHLGILRLLLPSHCV